MVTKQNTTAATTKTTASKKSAAGKAANAADATSTDRMVDTEGKAKSAGSKKKSVSAQLVQVVDGPKAAPAGAQGVSGEQRRHYVEVAAYFIAQQRGFEPGNDQDDWLAAEAEVDKLLASGRLPV